MKPFFHAFLAVALSTLTAGQASAQAAPDPSGHWEGAIAAPMGDVSFEVDLVRQDGAVAAFYSLPASGLKGSPLSSVAVQGTTVTFVLAAAGGGAFAGTLSEDGTSIFGTFKTERFEGKFTLPFSLRRTGDARVGALKSAAITRALEGEWKGALEVNGNRLGLVLTLANRPDGTSAGTVNSVDQGGVDIPIGISQSGSQVSLDIAGGTYRAELNAAGTELTGTFTQGAFTGPLTFVRAATAGAGK